MPAGQGGSFAFSIKPKKMLATGTVLNIDAVITFDQNDPIKAPPDPGFPLSYKLDLDLPTSRVNALPRFAAAPNFLMTWQGTDIGSGVRDFTIYVSDNGGPFVPWLVDLSDKQATFPGQSGHYYAFSSQARDNVFNTETIHPKWDTWTSVNRAATDVSASVSVTRSAFRYNRANGHYLQQVTLKNTGSTLLSGPISLVLDRVSSNAVLFNKNGVTQMLAPLGSPYIDTVKDFGDGFAPGETITQTLEFTNPSNNAITYATRVLAGPGCP